jgi:spore coat protein CotH
VAFFACGSIAKSPYTYFKADIWIDDVKIESVGVRKKGLFGSLDSDRPSLKVKFDEFVKQDPVKGLSRLTLNNNKQDKSQLSQFVTYQAVSRCWHTRSALQPRTRDSQRNVSGNLFKRGEH